ncbi:MAG TPA: hypothetical protein DDX89_04310 [Candidatus Omnitrophica bacterium]|nr:MAG: hypothetical protein A2Z92_02980 [Omnitrophica WOR_2 bacterium GWA2_63_20]OGX17174.1 MAG: hypothetical protein A2105_01175 [Omnitrophica WOR_2 bacterium GWF2_63_9]OGX31349.1 MAG: hypothetical protein A3E56_02305 [Omnitrophica WOR_2 bacterium RIFCSPHIGHO2_12_FULL_64_13]OGX34672.1 MAG: hypothetical protein A3B73_06000 [Omnitrophica WOR_2 bacterium RIFCSPHIGHO2_02_FULL_63_39]OGX44639.1 MAG: hypothetical protein A3I71_07065 [Omnitrophica WOR_2 bacterium RIFCSPLOWO2_02_FULL_63_16]OGX49209.1
MDLQRRLVKHLKRLNRTIRKVVAKAPEFQELRDLLRKEQVQLAIYVVPIIGGKPAGQELHFELTDEDRKFLKEAGISF